MTETIDQTNRLSAITKPGKDWLERLNQNGFTADKPYSNLTLEPLKEKLLTIAGYAVILPFVEEDLIKILFRGILTVPEKIKTVKGAPCRCHSNVCNYRERHPNSRIWTGYALSSHGGIWRQHSWLTGNKGIIETTETRIAYFGFEMTVKEADDFAEMNW